MLRALNWLSNRYPACTGNKFNNWKWMKRPQNNVHGFTLEPSTRYCQGIREFCSPSKITYISSQRLESFRKTKDDLVDELLDYSGLAAERHSLASTRFRKLMEENVGLWNYSRPMVIIRSYEEFVSEKNDDADKLHEVYTLGWCYELFETFVALLDDFVDGSDTRLDKKTWYRKNDDNMVAVYDSFLLWNAAHLLASKRLAHKLYYVHIHKLLTDISIEMILGQMADVLILRTFGGEKMLEGYSWNLYKQFTSSKDTFFVSAPIKFGMYVAGKYNGKTAAQIDRAAYVIGLYFQHFDDYLDYDDDINRGTCSIFAVLATKYANQEQRIVLRENFGKQKPENTAAVENVYHQLDMKLKFRQQEKMMMRHLDKQ